MSFSLRFGISTHCGLVLKMSAPWSLVNPNIVTQETGFSPVPIQTPKVIHYSVMVRPKTIFFIKLECECEISAIRLINQFLRCMSIQQLKIRKSWGRGRMLVSRGGDCWLDASSLSSNPTPTPTPLSTQWYWVQPGRVIHPLGAAESKNNQTITSMVYAFWYPRMLVKWAALSTPRPILLDTQKYCALLSKATGQY